MHFNILHSTSKFDAKQRIIRALEGARPHFQGHVTLEEERWEGDTLHIVANLQGKRISGTLTITDTEFIIDATLPLMWRLFEGRIEKMIAEQVERMKA